MLEAVLFMLSSGILANIALSTTAFLQILIATGTNALRGGALHIIESRRQWQWDL